MLDLMDERGISRAELSRIVRVTDATITQLFGPDKERGQLRSGVQVGSAESRLVPLINAAVGLPSPEINLERDAVRRELDAVWGDLDEEDRRELLTLAKRLSRHRR